MLICNLAKGLILGNMVLVLSCYPLLNRSWKVSSNRMAYFEFWLHFSSPVLTDGLQTLSILRQHLKVSFCIKTILEKSLCSAVLCLLYRDHLNNNQQNVLKTDHGREQQLVMLCFLA